MVDSMKNLISFFLSVVLLAFPIVFAQQEFDAAGGAATSSVLDIVGAVVAAVSYTHLTLPTKRIV